MKIPINYVMVICLLITAFSGCKKGASVVVPDTTKPAIIITQPTAAQAFDPGSTIIFQASFSDNEKLKSYEIAISKVVPVGLILKNVPSPVDWSYTKSATSFTAGVKQQDINLSDITIPSDIGGSPVAPGDYNFKVTCIDGSDNSTSTILIIKIN